MELKEPLLEWLQDAVCEPIVMGNDKLVEARGNLRRFSLSREQTDNLTPDDLCNFLDHLIESRRQVLAGRANSNSMLMYIWFDEMAGTLCSSLISSTEISGLPFSCPVETTIGLADIATRFLRSRYLEGIPYTELKPVLDTDRDGCEASFALEPLPVYVLRLP
jgi:hypothetical protein